jgi:hypothetical protein
MLPLSQAPALSRLRPLPLPVRGLTVSPANSRLRATPVTGPCWCRPQASQGTEP